MTDPLDLYRKMYLIRRCEETIQALYSQDEMRTPMHMSWGSEAIAVGVCSALGPDDQVFTSYRSHAVYLARTGDVEGFFLEMYGKAGGPGKGRQGSMHLANPALGHVLSSAVVGTQIPVAVGAAFANKRLNNGRKVAVFFGDGAVDQGVFWESLNVAAVWGLPVLFVYEDNGVAVETPAAARHAYREVTDVVQAFTYKERCRIMDIDCDADVREVQRVAGAALADMAERPRPSFLHLIYGRVLEHVGVNPSPSDPIPVDDPLEVEAERHYEDALERVRSEVDRRVADAARAAGWAT